ncbi:uncharacterized protein EAF01_001873 [Botrytis porri]|uniref:uncharacterized protein n=1 Tax=Botrytis porri TaxID=87229 RepID=UPI0019011856|nr:uncharacterized protein EAF01_001873 [Botrytis porri]KAF7912852.1 hypothetical protein EAF01_001873 [Botrytis porri]
MYMSLFLSESRKSIIANVEELRNSLGGTAPLATKMQCAYRHLLKLDCPVSIASGRDDVRGISGNTLQYLHGHGLTVYHHCTVVPSIAEEPTVNGAVNSTTTSNSNDSNTGSTQLKLLPMPILLIRSATDSNALDRMKHTHQDCYQAQISRRKQR